MLVLYRPTEIYCLSPNIPGLLRLKIATRFEFPPITISQKKRKSQSL